MQWDSVASESCTLKCCLWLYWPFWFCCPDSWVQLKQSANQRWQKFLSKGAQNAVEANSPSHELARTFFKGFCENKSVAWCCQPLRSIFENIRKFYFCGIRRLFQELCEIIPSAKSRVTHRWMAMPTVFRFQSARSGKSYIWIYLRPHWVPNIHGLLSQTTMK